MQSAVAFIVTAVAMAACDGSETYGDGSSKVPMANYAHDLNNFERLGGVAVSSGLDLHPVVPRSVPGGTGLVYRYQLVCPSFLGCESLRSEVHQAFRAWEVIGDISFVPWNDADAFSEPDIRIRFEDADHAGGCDGGFSTSVGTLAHAFTAECQIGEIHVNADLRWSLNGTVAIPGKSVAYDVRTVIVHEIGHLLGLNHSDDPLSVMYVEYNGSKRVPTENDGVRARQRVSALLAR